VTAIVQIYLCLKVLLDKFFSLIFANIIDLCKVSSHLDIYNNEIY
jgi:hypothetical protein